MSDNTLEAPGPAGNPDWDSLYLYKGTETVEGRPIFTGDVFFGAEVQGVGAIENKNIIVVQHPCALRVDGINLATSLIVAEVIPARLYAEREWQGNYKIMPLPFLADEDNPHHAAAFMAMYLAVSDSLDLGKRVASMSLTGVNLLLQRFMYHNSRAVLPTWKYNEVISGPYDEADCIEEWCTIRAPKGIAVGEASAEAAKWFDDDGGSGVTRRALLDNSQHRPQVRRAMKRFVRELEAPPRVRRRPRGPG
jgi:hypothetical protein